MKRISLYAPSTQRRFDALANGCGFAARSASGGLLLRRFVCHRSEPDWHFREKPIHLVRVSVIADSQDIGLNYLRTALRLLIPFFRQQRARFFHSSLPDLHHLLVIALIATAKVAVLEIFPHQLGVESA